MLSNNAKLFFNGYVFIFYINVEEVAYFDLPKDSLLVSLLCICATLLNQK